MITIVNNRWSVLMVIFCMLYTCSSAEQECSDDYYHDGPSTTDILVTSYFSVEHQADEYPSQCRVRYSVPLNATVYQGMKAAHQQHGENFTFEYDTYIQFGHHVTAINGVKGHDTTHWSLHHGDTLESAEYGVDLLHTEADDLYLWRFTDYDDEGFQPFNSTGECNSTIDDIIPALPFFDVVVYLSVSTENTALFTNGTFTSTMCKRLVVIPKTSTLYGVTLEANDQAITLFLAEIDSEDHAITELNGLKNQEGYSWRIFDVISGQIFPTDLTRTGIRDGGHYEYRFTEEDAISTQPYDDVTTESGSGKLLICNLFHMITLLSFSLLLL